MLVSWIEDWKYPVLSEMGLLDISLWSNTDVSSPSSVCAHDEADHGESRCMIDVPHSTRFRRGSHDEDASGHGARVGIEAGVQVVGVSFWFSFLLFGVVWGFLAACLLGA